MIGHSTFPTDQIEIYDLLINVYSNCIKKFCLKQTNLNKKCEHVQKKKFAIPSKGNTKLAGNFKSRPIPTSLAQRRQQEAFIKSQFILHDGWVLRLKTKVIKHKKTNLDVNNKEFRDYLIKGIPIKENLSARGERFQKRAET